MTAARRARGRAARRRGRWAEALCRLALRLKGYRIVASNRRSPLGEIDILARRGAVLAVVEVKARAGLEAAGSALDRRQRQRIARAARQWVAARGELGELSLRFDVMLVTPWRWPRHLPGAWDAEQP